MKGQRRAMPEVPDMIICQGCGQSFDVPEDYSRNKIQCPGCGVICAVPAEREPKRAGAAGRKAAPARKASAPRETAVEEEIVSDWLKEPPPAPLFDDEPAPPPRRAPAPPAKDMLVPCRRCGHMIKRQRECPICDAGTSDEPLPETPRPPAIGLIAGAMELEVEPAAGIDDEDDASPYMVADKDLPVCPKCRKTLAEGAVLCTACGFDLQKRKRAIRTYQPIERSWDTDMSLGQRLMWFGVYQGIHWILAILSAPTEFGIKPFFVTWPLLTAMLAFILGTYDRIRMERDKRGRVRIIKQWRFCFVPLTPVTTEVRGFEGVTTGQWHDAGFLEYFVFASLLFMGIVPGIIWWYHAIYKQHFHVALAEDHGHAAVWVYRGRSMEQMNDIAEALCNASGLRLVT